MKSNLKGLLVAMLLLPVMTIGQVFKAPEFSRHSDMQLMAKAIEKHSPLLHRLAASASAPIDITPEEARAILKEKLKELNNEALNETYSKLDEEGETSIGVVLHILMNGLSNEDDSPAESKTAIGGGLGVYVMWTLANFILMPELAYLIRPFKQEYGGDTYKERYSFLTLAFTAMYVVRLQAMSLLFGLSPNVGFALGGKYKISDGDWEDIELEDEGFNKTQIGLGIAAGIMLQNAMIIRLMYNLGLSKLYDDSDVKMYALVLSLQMPLWKLGK